MLRRQLTRRGHEASAVDKIMKETYDAAIKANMPLLIEHIKKQNMLKTIKQFANKNMQNMNRQEIEVISEKLIKEMKKRGII